MEKFKETINFLLSSGIKEPEIGVILGTGLGELVNYVDVIKTIDYSEIPNFPISTVEFHKGKLIYGKIKDKLVIVFQGRFHFYEGYSLEQITFPVRILKLMGVKNLLISNISGGINLNFKKGDLVVIDDFINLLPGSPLIGKNYDEFGERFPDMSLPFSSKMKELYKIACIQNKLEYKEGVYVAVTGPNLETKAEYRYLKTIGADMVGMSTVPEIIVANHMKLNCFAVSIITDECDPLNLKPVNVSEIIEIAGKSDKNLSKIFIHIINNIT